MTRFSAPLASVFIAGLVFTAAANLDAANKNSGYSMAIAALRSSEQNVRVAAAAVKGAKDRLDRALETKEQVEADRFRSLADDAPFPLAWNSYEQARKELQQATERALSNDEHQAALAKARLALNHADLIADLRSSTLSRDDRVQRCRTRFAIAKEKMESERRILLDADPQWAAAGFAARSAREDVQRAERNLDSALTARFKAKAGAIRAAHRVAAAKIAQQATKAKPKGGKGSKSKSKKKSGKKKRKPR